MTRKSYLPFIFTFLLILTTNLFTYAQNSSPINLETISASNLERLEALASWKPNDELLSPTITILPSRNSPLVLVTNRRQGLVGIIDVHNLALENVFHFSSTPLIRLTAISSDGRVLVTGDIQKVDIRDAITSKIKFTVAVPSNQFEINGIDISTEANLIAITVVNKVPEQSSLDATYIYNLIDGKQTIVFPDISSPTPLFSADGKYLILGGSDGILRLGNTETGEITIIASENGLSTYPRDILSSEAIVVALYDSLTEKSIVELWNIREQKPIEIRNPQIFSEYLKDGISQIPLNNYSALQLWDVINQKELALIQDESIEDIYVKGNLVITASMGKLSFRELDTGKLLYSISKPNLHAATFTSDYRNLILWSEEGYIEIWGMRTK